MQIDESNILKEVLGYIVAGVATALAWAIKTTHTRISTLEDCTVRKKDFDQLAQSVVKRETFDDYAERAKVERTELREGIVKLFDKVDEIKTILIQKNLDG
jgi:hypothetical protein